MNQIDQIDQDSFTMTMQMNNVIYQMVYPLPQQQIHNMNQYMDTNYPTQDFSTHSKPDDMDADALAPNYVHASLISTTMDTIESIDHFGKLFHVSHSITGDATGDIQQTEQPIPPTTVLLNQMEVDDHQMENQLDITLHQPIYQIPNLNITLSHDNSTQQQEYTPTQPI